MYLKSAEMVDNHIYEMTENEAYPTFSAKRGNTAALCTGCQHHGTAAKPAPLSLKCFRWIASLAIFFNFLLIIAVGAALYYYQTKLIVTEEIVNGFTGGSSRSNISGPPGIHNIMTEAAVS